MNNTVEELGYLLQNNFDEAIEEFKYTLDQVAVDFKEFAEDIKVNISFSGILEESKLYVGLINDIIDIRQNWDQIIGNITSIQDKITEIQKKSKLSKYPIGHNM